MEGGVNKMSNVMLRRLLALFLLTILISGCSESDNGASDEIDGEDLSEVEIEQEEPLQSAFTDDRLEGMIGIEENDYLQLFVDEDTMSVAVINKANDEIWYSNPPERDSDPIASGVNSDILSSQMQLSFYNNFGQRSNMNSYSDSVVHQQTNAEKIENGLSVQYQFGNAARSAADLPLMLSAARFEELSSKLDSTGQRALIIGYREDSETGNYDRQDGALTGLQLERAFTAFEEAGYTEEDLEADMAELGFSMEREDDRVFIAKIEYTLEDDSLLVNVPTDDIYFETEFPVERISFLRFFGAAGTEEEGSIFVPDGSGALINFNNGKTNYPSYQQSVYGQDLALLQDNDVRSNETVRLPVFGLIKEDNAVLGIIENGASVASISADVSGRLNSYNFVYPSFEVVTKDDVSLKTEDQERALPRFQDEKMKSDFTVRYVFLEGDDANYTSMAKYYQNYLVNADLLRDNEKSDTTENIPFYLQLIGSINKQQHFAGVPYQSLHSLTTFDEAEEILDEMLDADIDNIKLNYIGWFNRGVDHRIPTKIKVDRKIGGKKGFNEFLEYADNNGIKVFPETAMLQVHNESGFKPRSEASRKLTNLPAAVYPIDRAIRERDQTRDPHHSLSPRFVEEYTNEFLEEFTPFNTTGVTLRDLADVLNSDFRRNEQIDRTESETISVNALKSISDQNLEIIANGGNLYSLAYLTDVIDAPLGNTGYKIEDESIPFYQTVLRGYIDYASAPFNMSTYLDNQEYILNALEYGSNINFQWIHESNEVVKNTEFDHLYSVNYERWFDQATEIYHEVNDILKKVKNVPIQSHENLGDNVYRTVYENGIYVVVNYGLETANIDGNAIEPQSYITGGE